MAILMAPPQAPPHPIVESELFKSRNPEYDLNKAIFLPFATIRPMPLSSETPLSQTQKLQKIVENVKHQQGLVRGNLENVVLNLAGRLIGKAEQELINIREETADWVVEDAPKIAEAKEEKRREAAALMKFMQRPARKDATPEYFTKMVRDGHNKTASQSRGVSSWKRDALGEIKTSAADNNAVSQPRLPLTIRTEVSADLRALITDGTEQLEACDKLSSATLDRHKRELVRYTSGGVISSVPPVVARSGLENLKTTPHPMNIERHDSRFDTSSLSPMKASPGLEDKITTPQRASSIRRESKNDFSTPSPKRVRFDPSVEILSTTPERTATPPSVKVRSRSGSGSGIISRTPQRATTFPGVLFNEERVRSPEADGKLRRTSTGMPIAGSAALKPVRKLQTMEELARGRR
ncbi:hypothetical protein VTL71DRAFT_2690 [Oculimacula yallundae]|uniref:Uncharacterized protein n=1 Tax=Oculimacula yallundae TaxID=86028 RepID=A0ABR4CBP5_9HELO